MPKEKKITTAGRHIDQLDHMPITLKNSVLLLQEAELINEQLILMKIDQEDFLHAVSHDLRGPVNNIEGIAELLKESLQKEDIAEIKTLMGYMQNSVKSMGELILDLTEERKKQKAAREQIETIDLFAISDEVIILLQHNTGLPAASISTNFLVTSVKFDKKNLRTILYSLISNSFIHFSGNRSLEIHIQAIVKGDFIEISVKDNGKGIDETVGSNILMKQKKSTSTRKNTGLSLYVLNKLMEINGGKIEIKSALDNGLEVTIFLKA